MTLERTYNIVKPDFPAMKWEEYENIVRSEWSDLLSAENSGDETKFQSFFERHPCMLPRTFEVFGDGADIWPHSLITNPVLPEFTRKIPDFMWIAYDSVAMYAVLIEIEAPGKPWATSEGRQHHKLTEAINQIKDWKSWFSDPLNQAQFQKYYRIPDKYLRGRQFLQRYILIYGRRKNAIENENFAKKRAHLQGENEKFMTYDRLHPNKLLSGLLTVKIDREGYKAVSICPTIELGPLIAEYWSIIRDKELVIKKNEYISEKRKEFLLGRSPYWDKWGRNGKIGIIGASDFE